jgi:hypothetical protein
VSLTLRERPPDPCAPWRSRLAWHPVSRAWLLRLADLVRRRGSDAGAVLAVVARWEALHDAVEQAAFAVTPRRPDAIGPPLGELTAPLSRVLDTLDRDTAAVITEAMPRAGTRLSHLWAPTWPDASTSPAAAPCACGCPVLAHGRRHPTLALARIELSCPTCSHLGDVSGHPPGAGGGADTMEPDLLGALDDRSPGPGDRLRCRVRLSAGAAPGFARAVLVEPYARRAEFGESVAAGPGTDAPVPLRVPPDWPRGLSWVAVVVVAGGAISHFSFDVVVATGGRAA